MVQNGFTLTELAVVLVIVALLLGGMLVPLATQRDIANFNETQRRADQIRDALIGFATTNGRLPCPAWDGSGADTVNSKGQERFAAGGSMTDGNCAHFHDGFVPAAALGLADTDSEGFALDGWGHRIRYAVSAANGDAFTASGKMQAIGIGALSPDLNVCSSSTGVTATNCGGTANTLAGGVPVVVFSMGKNAPTVGGSDEAENTDGDVVFVIHEPTPASAANGEFDDYVLWLSPYILYNRMVAAGKLP